jgi:hypothetical protein
LYKFEILVVATTPLILEVMTPALAVKLFEFIKLVEVASPFTILVIVFTAEFREFWFINLAVVVATFPFTVDVSTNELVEVETIKVFVVGGVTTIGAEAIPFTVVVSSPVEVENKLPTELIIVVVETMPLTFVVRVFNADTAVFVETTLLVATTPFIVVVKVLPDRVCVNEFIKLVTADEMPFTIEVKEFVVVEITFVVFEATSPASEVVDITPFTLDIKSPPFVVKLFPVIIELVATTPFTVLVSTFPVADCMKEFMKFVKAEVTPFIMFAKEFVVVEIKFEFMIVEVETFPFTLLDI